MHGRYKSTRAAAILRPADSEEGLGGPDGKTFFSNFSDGYDSLILLLKIIHICG